MQVRLTHDAQSVILTTEPATFRVVWCSHWALLDDLVAAGVLRRDNYGPATYGHCDYFYV